MAEFASSPLPVARPVSSLATPSLDDKIEYMDGFGVPRRSQTYTRRMILRGHEIKMPDDLINVTDDNGPIDESASEKTRRAEAREQLDQEKDQDAKRKANAAFKHQCKTERQQWIDGADKRLVDRLTVWYDGTSVPADADFVAVTEKHTQLSPSNKAQSFIDADGNVRRKSAVQLASKADGTAQAELGGELRPTDTVGVSPPCAPTAGTGASPADKPSS